jgi:hypothetical protein
MAFWLERTIQDRRARVTGYLRDKADRAPFTERGERQRRRLHRLANIIERTTS